MDAAHLTAINDLSRASATAHSRSWGRVWTSFAAAASAGAFTLAAVGAIEGWAAWKSWSETSSIRLSLRAVQSVTAARWALATSVVEDRGNVVPQDQILSQQAAARRAPVSGKSNWMARRPLARSSVAKHNVPGGRGVNLAQRSLLFRLAVRHRVSLLAVMEAPERSGPASPMGSERARRVAKRVLTPKAKFGHVGSQSVRGPATEVADTSVPPSSIQIVAPMRPETGLRVTPKVPATPQGLAPENVSEGFRQETTGGQVANADGANPSARVHRDTAGATKLRRYTKPNRGDQWLLSEGPAVSQADVLYTPSNVAVPRHLPSGLTTHEQAGSGSQQNAILSGWISSGARVSISSAKAPVRYFSVEGHEVSENSPGEKFFVAEGVRPGASVARAVSVSNGQTVAAAGVPVLAGKMTQVDLRALERRSARGVVLDSRSSQPRGIAHAEVRVVGLPDVVSITDASGRFDFGQIPVTRGLPVYLEVRLGKGFTHRYAMTAEQLERGAPLFYFSPQRVARWLQSLEGGVSESSGLIVASVPRAKVGLSRPVAMTQGSATELEPETYWLDSQDQLHSPGHSVPGEGPYVQWVGLNLTGPSALVGLQSHRNRWVEAHWMPISPGVVSVLSPSE